MNSAQALGTLLQTAPWQVHLMHEAPCHRLIWIVQGQGRILLGTRRRGFGTHNLMFIPAGQIAAFDPGPAAAGFVLNLEAHTDHNTWPTTPLLMRISDGRQQGELTALCDSMLREHRESRAHYTDALRALAGLVSVWLSRALIATPPQTDTYSSPGDRLIAAFLEDLTRHYRSGDAMAVYATRLDVTAAHLSRLCKTQLGRSAAQIVAERILHAARMDLETTTRPAKTIAAELGFKAAPHFTRFIQSHTGQSPRALRSASTRKTGPPHAHPTRPTARNVAFKPK